MYLSFQQFQMFLRSKYFTKGIPHPSFVLLEPGTYPRVLRVQDEGHARQGANLFQGTITHYTHTLDISISFHHISFTIIHTVVGSEPLTLKVRGVSTLTFSFHKQ